MRCPHCGFLVVPDDKYSHLSNLAGINETERLILKLMIKHGSLTRERMLYNLWSARGRDEPKTSETIVNVTLHRLRKKLRLQGYEIINRNNLGHANTGVYELRELNSEGNTK